MISAGIMLWKRGIRMNKLKTSQHAAPRKDVIVSVRLPKSLIDELKDIQKVNHFIDLSDEIRFVVRRYCLSFLNTQQSNIQPPIEAIAEQRRKEKLIDELTKIIETLKGNKQPYDMNPKNMMQPGKDE